MIDSFISRQVSEKTKQAYKRALSAFSEFYSGKFPEGNKWTKDFILHLQSKKLSNRTINWNMTVLKQFYKTMLGQSLYFDRLKEPTIEIVSLTPEDVRLLLLESSKEFEPALRFFLDTGVRVDELRKLSEKSFTSIPSEFIIMGKGNKQRVVAVSFETHNLLKTPHLFGSPWSVRRIQYHLKKLGDVLGLPFLHPHILRHTFATTALNNGVNILEIKEMLGHAFLQTTEKYTHVTQGRLKEVWKKYHSRTTALSI